MPTKETHLHLAEKNQEAIDLLCSDLPRYSEWVATIAFYRAVHLVEAVFAGYKMHANSHDDRLARLKREKRFAHIYPHFRILYSASLVARYLGETRDGRGIEYRTFSDYLSADEVRNQILDHRLRQIEKSVQRHLSGN